jgi:hypothetical protein
MVAKIWNRTKTHHGLARRQFVATHRSINEANPKRRHWPCAVFSTSVTGAVGVEQTLQVAADNFFKITSPCRFFNGFFSSTTPAAKTSPSLTVVVASFPFFFFRGSFFDDGRQNEAGSERLYRNLL